MPNTINVKREGLERLVEKARSVIDVGEPHKMTDNEAQRLTWLLGYIESVEYLLK